MMRWWRNHCEGSQDAVGRQLAAKWLLNLVVCRVLRGVMFLFADAVVNLLPDACLITKMCPT